MHPPAVRIFERAAGNPGEKFSPTEIAAEFGEPLGNVSYHVRTLLKSGLLESAGTTPRRGALQHHYRDRRQGPALSPPLPGPHIYAPTCMKH
jgi:DNA-binding transcriptional ArsR family regulator